MTFSPLSFGMMFSFGASRLYPILFSSVSSFSLLFVIRTYLFVFLAVLSSVFVINES